MNQNDTRRYQALLTAKKAELMVDLHHREGIVIEKTSDELDTVQLSGLRELAIRNLDRGSNQLRLVEQALIRIDAGEFGVCLHCEEPIKPKRLNAVPWAKYCIKCQEMADANPGNVGEFELITA